MKPKETVKIPPLSELKGKSNCRWCGGRGTIAMLPASIVKGGQIRSNLDATKFRLVVPCKCVHMTIRWNE